MQSNSNLDDLAKGIARQLEQLRTGRGFVGHALAGTGELQDIIFDTGASFHLAPRSSLVPGTTSADDGGVLLGTAAGSRFYENSGDLDIRPLGRLRAVQVDDGSPCALSVGRLVREGLSFVWLADDPLHPVVFDREGGLIPLAVEADVPVLRDLGTEMWAITAAERRALPGQASSSSDPAPSSAAHGADDGGGAHSPTTTAEADDAAAVDANSQSELEAPPSSPVAPPPVYDMDGLALEEDQPVAPTAPKDDIPGEPAIVGGGFRRSGAAPKATTK